MSTLIEGAGIHLGSHYVDMPRGRPARPNQKDLNPHQEIARRELAEFWGGNRYKMAADIGASDQAIWYWVTGSRTPQAQFVARIERKTGRKWTVIEQAAGRVPERAPTRAPSPPPGRIDFFVDEPGEAEALRKDMARMKRLGEAVRDAAAAAARERALSEPKPKPAARPERRGRPDDRRQLPRGER